jgi:UDP-N-acetylglucosamine acyltransferase
MPTIHSTAIVESQVELANDVIIGPGALVRSGAKIGSGCQIFAHAIIEGNVQLGECNKVGYGAVLGAAPQDIGFNEDIKSEVIVGDNNFFREYVTVHRGAKEESKTRIGNNNFLMVGCHIGHNVVIGNNVIIANNCLLAGQVEVQDGANLGGGSVFHQFIRIGKLAMVRGGTRFVKDIPPYLVAYGTNQVSGVNAIGLRRAGISSAIRMEIKKAFRLMYAEGFNVSQALKKASELTWSPEASHFFEFIAQAKLRGICHARIRSGD